MTWKISEVCVISNKTVLITEFLSFFVEEKSFTLSQSMIKIYAVSFWNVQNIFRIICWDAFEMKKWTNIMKLLKADYEKHI